MILLRSPLMNQIAWLRSVVPGPHHGFPFKMEEGYSIVLYTATSITAAVATPNPIALLSPIVPYKLHARMVDYRNPNTVTHDSGLCSSSVSGACSPIHPSVFSIAALVHLHHVVDGLFMCVSLPCCACLQGFTFCTLDYSHLAGNSLLPLTMSGMSFEGVAHTDGQYGSVDFSRVSSPRTHNKGLISTCFRFTHLRAWQPF
jgi:hypothetical protein